MIGNEESGIIVGSLLVHSKIWRVTVGGTSNVVVKLMGKAGCATVQS